MNKPNVMILITASYGGGAERLVLDQMKYYNRKEYTLHVATLRRDNIEEKFKKAGADNYFSLGCNGRFSLRALGKLRRYIKENDIKLVHTHLMESDMYGFLLNIIMPGVKFMSVRHDSGDFRKKIHMKFLNHTFSLADEKIICDSMFVKNFIKRYERIPEKKLRVVYNSVDTKKFKRRSCPGLRKELAGGDKNAFLIGIIGRLEEQKGHKYLFEAIKILKDKGSPVIPKVLVVGNGKLEAMLRDMRRDLGLEENVKFLGFRTDLADIYNAIDVLCLPSEFEGLSLVLLEALASNTLVVCSDIENNMEAVEDGVSGLAFRMGDSRGLADQIENVTTGKVSVEKIRENARKRVLEQFNFEKNLKKIEQVYKEILGKK